MKYYVIYQKSKREKYIILKDKYVMLRARHTMPSDLLHADFLKQRLSFLFSATETTLGVIAPQTTPRQISR